MPKVLPVHYLKWYMYWKPGKKGVHKTTVKGKKTNIGMK